MYAGMRGGFRLPMNAPRSLPHFDAAMRTDLEQQISLRDSGVIGRVDKEKSGNDALRIFIKEDETIPQVFAA